MIYCVEDDDSIRELMVYTLQASGFEACGFQDVAAFWDMMKEKKLELVILDIMLPGEDGISILKKLRTSPVPLYFFRYKKIMKAPLGNKEFTLQ